MAMGLAYIDPWLYFLQIVLYTHVKWLVTLVIYLQYHITKQNRVSTFNPLSQIAPLIDIHAIEHI